MLSKVANRIRRLTNDHQKPLSRALGRELIGVAARRPRIRKAMNAWTARDIATPLGTIFLCGCYNSGTTIVREMLGSHRAVSSMPREGVVYTRRLTSHSNGRWSRFWPDRRSVVEADHRDFETLSGSDLLEDWALWVRDDRHFLEKSITNSTRMTRLQGLFPDARFIVMRRDGEGVAEGIRRRTRPLGPPEVSGPRPTFDEALEQWRFCNAMIDEQIGSLERVMEVSYENLVATPAEQMRAVFAFLEIDATVVPIEGGITIDDMIWPVFDGNNRSRANMRRASGASI